MVDVNAILNERSGTHGEFFGHAQIAQELKEAIHSCRSWNHLSSDKREALDMIAHKIARILNGNPNHVDHWADIAGYATLVANRLDGLECE